MSNITRVYTPSNIFEAPANIYINLTNPDSSRTPNADDNCLVLNANGEPDSATGFHAGLVEAPTMPSVTEKFNEIRADQLESPIDIALVSIEAEIDFVLKETNLSRFKALLPNTMSNYQNLANSEAWQVGGMFDCSVEYLTVTAIAPRRDLVGKFVYWHLYRCVLVSAFPISMQRSKESTYKVKVKGIADTSREIGDEIMQIVRQKAA